MNKLDSKTWECDDCAEAEGVSGLPCIVTSPFAPSMELCPVSGQECDWYETDTRADSGLVKALKEYGEHLDTCSSRWSVHSPEWHPCDCGFDEALALHESEAKP